MGKRKKEKVEELTDGVEAPDGDEDDDEDEEEEGVKKTIEDLLSRIDQLEKSSRKKEVFLKKYAKSELKRIHDLLQEKPYSLDFEDIKSLTLQELKDKKAIYDTLPIVRDFSEPERLTHENVDKNIFDLQTTAPDDSRTGVLQKAQEKFKTDFGKDRDKR